MGILFCVIHCTPEVYIYCSKLSAAHQGDRFTSCATLLLSPSSPGIDPVRVDGNVQPREVVPLKNRPFVTGTGNHRQPLFTFTCNLWSTVLPLKVVGNIMY